MSAENWEALLEREGLGVIEPNTYYGHVGGARRPKKKWARLDAEVNDLQNKAEFMTESPETARGFETKPSSKQGGQPDDLGYAGEPEYWERGENDQLGEDRWDDFVAPGLEPNFYYLVRARNGCPDPDGVADWGHAVAPATACP